ncbi:MAG: glycine--tRNA ligase [Verrucomicrobiales bacterium]|nr:glycine--tRNA ligase [Verrucomicrobiae bacterium]MCP5552939.1 glycine--tRNA ligase [Akkermansiaceae bacterium]HRX53463.1 glycine--tRNA ligase [Verrucomicrobiales bacterium]
MSQAKDHNNTALMEKIVSLCKRRGIIFQSSEIYGGLNGFWDYGPLGAELKRNLRDAWWRTMTREREDVVGLDATIIMHPSIWKASGHVDTFCDMMVDCKTCKGRFRADHIGGISCPQKPSKCVADCAGEKTEPRPFNLMFQTYVGPIISEENVAYLRPETAQAIFAQYKNVLDSSRVKVPFGICQIGKAFRNEITPRNYTFRSREFEQMELEFFIKPDEAIEIIHGAVAQWSEGADISEPRANWGWEMWHRYWVEERTRFYESIGLTRDHLDYHWQTPDELAHYARACVDILFKFPFGTEELEGIAARGDFDLSQHSDFVGKYQDFFDEELKAAAAKLTDEEKQALVTKKLAEAEEKTRKLAAKDQREASEEEITAAKAKMQSWCERLFKGFYIPHVIEPSAGLDRLALAILCAAFQEEEKEDINGKKEMRTYLRFHPRVAPTKIGIYPLLKNKPELVAKAREVYRMLKSDLNCFYDETAAIGRRYARQDEVGTPFGVTIDFETLGENAPELLDTVTVRERDSGAQSRVPLSELRAFLLARMQ